MPHTEILEMMAGQANTPFDYVCLTSDGVPRDLTEFYGGTVELFFQPPSGNTFKKAAILLGDGVDCTVRYVKQLTDTEFDVAGKWQFQPHLSNGGKVRFGKKKQFTILANIAVT